MIFYSIGDLKNRVKKGELNCFLHCQIEEINDRLTKNNDPYKEVRVFDSFNRLTIRAWSSSEVFKELDKFSTEDFVAINGDWSISQSFGLESSKWTIRPLDDEEIKIVLSGSPKQVEKVSNDLEYIKNSVSEISDPRLNKLCKYFLEKYEDKLMNTAAARTYHHARRGGLIEHNAQMIRASLKLCDVYQNLNSDLLVAGVLFHDSGKLWENSYNKNSFIMPHSFVGELMGHINLGIELVNSLWKELTDEFDESYKELVPSNKQVKMHLLHLIASHHGEHEWGAPVLPKTSEAIILHFVDNIDAKLEMFNEAYKFGNEVGKDIFDQRRPLRQKYIKSLDKYESLSEDENNSTIDVKDDQVDSKKSILDEESRIKKENEIFPEFIPEDKK